MFIVDAQIHLSTAGSGKTRGGQRTDGVSAEEISSEMKAAGVSRAMLVTASWDPLSNNQCLEAARRYPDRFAVFGLIPFNKPDSQNIVSNWMTQPGMLGARVNLRKVVLDLPEAANADFWLWSALERANIPIMLHAAEDFSPVQPIAKHYSGLRICICHLGVPSKGPKDDRAFANMPHLLELARLSNVCVKSSSLPTASSETYPFRGTHKYLRQVYDAFGPSRMFWGTDLSRLEYWNTPGKPRHCSYREAVTMFTEELDWLSTRDKELIMGEALCKWAGWALPADHGNIANVS